MAYNASTSTLPPLAFASPSPPRGLMLSRRQRPTFEPPLLKRKHAGSSSSVTDMDASYLPASTNLPYLNCANFGNEIDVTHGASTACLPIPYIKLDPRTKRSRKGCFLSSSPQEHYIQELSNYGEETRRRDTSSPSEDEMDGTLPTVDAAPRTGLQRASSSKSMISRRPTMQLSRSFSLQFNLSFLNLTAAGTSNGGPNSDSLSASSPSILPTRKSFLHIQSSSSQDMSNPKDEQSREVSQRRRPVATTLDYLATSIRFPDVTIGLSI